MNPQSLKLVVAVAILCLTYGVAFHLGGNGPRASLAALRAAQSETVARAVLAEKASGDAELGRVNAILRKYENESLNPIDLHISTRLFRAACPTRGPLPQTVSHTAIPSAPTPIASVDSRIGPALDAVISNCQADAKQIIALIEAWPR